MSVPVVHAWALVPTTKHPHTLPWTTAREAQIPPPSIDAVVPRAQPPHFWAHSLNPVKPVLVVRIL